MNTVDRILIALMVLLLPIGLLISNQLMSSSTKKDEVTIDAQKLKVMVENYSNMQVDSKPKKDIIVSSVSYASESGIISVSGDAPSSQTSVLMSVTVLPPDPSPTPTTSVTTKENILVLGRSVKTYSFDTKGDGTFQIDYEVELPVSIIELRFEQDDWVKTVRFDLIKGEQVY